MHGRPDRLRSSGETRNARRSSVPWPARDRRPLIVEGEAGIGKTTLWTFAIEVARARGDRVLAWRASSAERELAFGALMGLLDGLENAALDAVDPPRRRALELALGRIEARGPGAGRRVSSDSPCSMSSGRSQRPGPLVVAVDDIQWCDPASAGALAFAARRLRDEPIAFVFASRTVSTAAAAIGAGVGAPGGASRPRPGRPADHRRAGPAHPRPARSYPSPPAARAGPRGLRRQPVRGARDEPVAARPRRPAGAR